jgi:hypothetical protein
MQVQLPNYLTYIAHLIRNYSINARNLLNAITGSIDTIEKHLH